MRRTVIVMLKEPRAGRVKTRLGRDIGMTASAWWFRHQVRGLLRRIADPRWDVVLCVAPDRAGLQSRVWPAQFPRIPQGRGDLGTRMARALRSVRGPVCVIGGDIPGVTPARLAEAFAALGAHEVVFGPAVDGGYWLIGLRQGVRQPRGFLRGVRWSSADALADSVATLGDARVARVATLRDVDRVADLRELER